MNARVGSNRLRLPQRVPRRRGRHAAVRWHERTGRPVPGRRRRPGALAAEKSCAEFTTDLAGHHYAGHTNYTITLEVWNDDGESDTDTTSVKVFVPPEG